MYKIADSGSLSLRTIPDSNPTKVAKDTYLYLFFLCPTVSWVRENSDSWWKTKTKPGKKQTSVKKKKKSICVKVALKVEKRKGINSM